ncbi:MAG: hypothetical protein ACRBEE_14230 [Arenicella sp.]
MKIDIEQIDKRCRFEADKTIENALKLDKSLNQIVRAELQSGNLIKDVSIGWPEKESVVVSFSKGISADHSTGGNVEYTFVNDIRYWIHEYTTTTNPKHLVIG